MIPTDTIYGISAVALDEKAVGRVYDLKNRSNKKPFIVLISSIADLGIFEIKVDDFTKKILEKYWPGKITVVLDCPSEKFSYLHFGTNALAFRIPDKKDLLNLLSKTGPLVSTSVNHPGEKPAVTIAEAKEYFGSSLDFYVDEGKLESLPSTVIRIQDGKIVVLREGAVKIN